MTRVGEDGREYIDQFMWSFQVHFRLDLAIRAKQAFKEIGLAVDPRAMLVGFAISADQPHQICVEPEDGPFAPADLADVLTSASELYKMHDDRNIIVTGEGQQSRFDAGSLDRSRSEALESALQSAGREPDRRYFVGRSRVVGGYRVYPVLSVIDALWATVLTLPPYEAGRIRLSDSFAEELIRQLLHSAELSLAVGREPAELVSFGRSPAMDVVRLAASMFVEGIPMRMGGVPSGLMESLDALAAAPYEGRAALGRITFVRRAAQPELLIKFTSSVALSRTRGARKLLEMTGPDRYLASDGQDALGLIERPDGETGEFEVAFTGRGAWTLSWSKREFLHVAQGRPRFPSPPLGLDVFRDNFDRLFGAAEGSDAEIVWALVGVAATQEHGTMLVIHKDAESEARRLGSQAVAVAPVQLSSESLYAASRIDGAVLVSPDGRCHAIGVILDGIAGDSGDPARGARFNSASRYVDAYRDSCLILVVSEDGTIELVPESHRRVSRAFIDRVVLEVVTASEGDIDFEAFSRLVDRALAHRFYLSQEQCDAITAARERAESKRRGDIRMIIAPLVVDRWMNDTYFFDG